MRTMDPSDAIDLLLDNPATTGVFTDFDGTLSPIVDRPQDARPVDGASETLGALAPMFGLVAVVSGRSLEDLRERFSPPGVVLAGSYGRERSDVGGPRRRTEGWETIGVAASTVPEDLPGVVVERKGQGIALHYRAAPELAEAVAERAADLAREFELEMRPGRLVVELVAPGPGKGDAIDALVRDYRLSALLFAGDDVADLEAFVQIRGMDVRPVLVAVASEEAPGELADAADLVVGDPEEFVAFVRTLRDRAGAG